MPLMPLKHTEAAEEHVFAIVRAQTTGILKAPGMQGIYPLRVLRPIGLSEI
jgi:hypothetical protein